MYDPIFKFSVKIEIIKEKFIQILWPKYEKLTLYFLMSWSLCGKKAIRNCNGVQRDKVSQRKELYLSLHLYFQHAESQS